MNVVQSWIVVGIPALLAIAALFVGNSQVRALAGYAVLAATIVFFLAVPGDPFSAGLLGLIGFAAVASGRGQQGDLVAVEHHENRRRFTVARPD